MKFKSIKMINFMRYKGENVLEFSCSDTNNVSVVLGDNSFGKTTIAQAFRWGLYEKINTTNYYANEKDISLLNSEVAARMRPTSIEKVSVEITVIDGDNEWKFIRTARFQRANNIPDDITVKQIGKTDLVMMPFKNGIPGTIIDNDGSSKTRENNYYEGFVKDFINNMFPETLSNYFLFDGERWNNLKNKKKEIKDSIHTILGISELEAMQKHFSGNNSVIKKLQDRIKGSDDQLTKLKESIDYLGDKIDKDTKNEESIRDTADALDAEIQQYEKILEENRPNDELKQRVSEYENDVKSLKKNKDSHYRNFIKLFSSSYRYIAAGLLPEIKELLDTVDLTGKDIPGVTVDTVEYLIKQGHCLCGTELTDDSEAMKELIKLKKVIPPEMLGGAAKRFVSDLERWKREENETVENMTEFAENYRNCIDFIESKQDQIDRLNDRIDRRTNTGDIRKNLIQIKDRQKKLYKEADRLKTSLEYNEEKKSNQEIQLEELSRKTAQNATINRSIDYARAILEKTKQRIEIREKTLLSDLNDIISVNFEKMFNEKEKVAVMELDYKIHVYYKNLGNMMTREEYALSGGEQIALNFVFIVSILELAKKWKMDEDGDETILQLPLVLDAPFSNLSGLNASLISQKLPLFAEQVIIFMLDKDWESSGLSAYTNDEYCYRVVKEQSGNSSSLEKGGDDPRW